MVSNVTQATSDRIDRVELPTPQIESKGPSGVTSPVQDIPDSNARIQAIFNREHGHPFEVLDNIYKLQREKTKSDLAFLD